MDYLEIAQLKSKSGVSAPTSVAGPMSPVPVSALGTQLSHRRDFDATGQIAPPGVEPRVTAIMWDEEGTRCFQVDAKGICIARREDNNNINGTKLLNVTGMTRGRRFGILDFEVKRHVVRLGPMHLRGIWIPFERALDLANREKITHLVYPLFARNIEELLDHPVNHTLQFELYEGEDEQAVTSLPEREQLRTPPASKASTVQSASFSTVEDRGATILPLGVSVGSNSSLPSTSGTASPEHTNSSDSIMSVGYLLNDT